MEVVPLGVYAILSLVCFWCFECWEQCRKRRTSSEGDEQSNASPVVEAPVSSRRGETIRLLGNRQVVVSAPQSNYEMVQRDLEGTYRAPRDSPVVPASPPFARLRDTPSNVSGKKEGAQATFHTPSPRIRLHQRKEIGTPSTSSGASDTSPPPPFTISLSDDSEREQSELVRKIQDRKKLKKEKKQDQAAAAVTRTRSREEALKMMEREARGVTIPYKTEADKQRREVEKLIADLGPIVPSVWERARIEMEKEKEKKEREGDAGVTSSEQEIFEAEIHFGEACCVSEGTGWNRTGTGVSIGQPLTQHHETVTKKPEEVTLGKATGAVPKRPDAREMGKSTSAVPKRSKEIGADGGASTERPESREIGADGGAATERPESRELGADSGALTERPEAREIDSSTAEQPVLQYYGAVPNRPEETGSVNINTNRPLHQKDFYNYMSEMIADGEKRYKEFAEFLGSIDEMPMNPLKRPESTVSDEAYHQCSHHEDAPIQSLFYGTMRNYGTMLGPLPSLDFLNTPMLSTNAPTTVAPEQEQQRKVNEDIAKAVERTERLRKMDEMNLREQRRQREEKRKAEKAPPSVVKNQSPEAEVELHSEVKTPSPETEELNSMVKNQSNKTKKKLNSMIKSQSPETEVELNSMVKSRCPEAEGELHSAANLTSPEAEKEFNSMAKNTPPAAEEEHDSVVKNQSPVTGEELNPMVRNPPPETEKEQDSMVKNQSPETEGEINSVARVPSPEAEGEVVIDLGDRDTSSSWEDIDPKPKKATWWKRFGARKRKNYKPQKRNRKRSY